MIEVAQPNQEVFLASGNVIPPDAQQLITEQVALALIDALALWMTPVNDSLETRQAIALDDKNQEIKQQPKEKEQEKSQTKEIKEQLTSKDKHTLHSSNIATRQEHTHKQTKGTILSPFAMFTKTTKEQQHMRVTSSTVNAQLEKATDKQHSFIDKPTHHFDTKESRSCASKVDTQKSSKESQNPKELLKNTPQQHYNQTSICQHEQQHQFDYLQEHKDHQSQDEIIDSDSEEIGISKSAKRVNQVAQAHFKQENVRNEQDPVAKSLKQEAKEFSAQMGMRISHFDVLLIFIELMKLEITSHEEDKLARRAEREAQLKLLEKEVASFKDQANSLLFIHVGAGILGVVGGVTPIVGHMAGDSILNSLSSVSFLSGLADMPKQKAFDAISKIANSLSETQRAVGSIYDANSQGDRTRYNRYADLHKTDHDEMTRHIDQLMEQFRQSERFLLDMLQMRHDITSQLYR